MVKELLLKELDLLKKTLLERDVRAEEEIKNDRKRAEESKIQRNYSGSPTMEPQLTGT